MRSAATFTTPWGPGTVVVEAGRLSEVRLPQVSAEASRADDAAPVAVAGGRAPAVDEGLQPSDEARRWASELEEYFRGERLGWTEEEVDLTGYGFTPFRTEVYRALLDVPAGSTVTYGELAARAGRPGAARAVGSAMADNPIAVVVPCHRVVRNDGSLGHYGFGDPWKPFLLEREGARA